MKAPSKGHGSTESGPAASSAPPPGGRGRRPKPRVETSSSAGIKRHARAVAKQAAAKPKATGKAKAKAPMKKPCKKEDSGAPAEKADPGVLAEDATGAEPHGRALRRPAGELGN